MTLESYVGNAAENYERFFVPHIGAPVARGLLDIAEPAAGERILDVACGTGVVTRAAAERVGAGGHVAGLDLNPGMLDVARSLNGPRPIEWHQASAESMPLPDHDFDVVLCQMGLQFVCNKLAALREMRRVLTPGGRLVLNVPGPIPGPFAQLAEALIEHVSSEAAGFCHLVFSLHQPDELRELAAAAGFQDSDAHHAPVTLEVPPPVDFLWGYICSTPLIASFANIDEARRAALQSDVSARWEPFTTRDGMSFDLGVTTLTAR